MKNHTRPEFSVDNASILFLSLIKPYHTNSFRFCMTLKQPVDPELLQQAVNRIYKRFPSVIAGLRQDFLHYKQVAAPEAPIVRPDPGLLKAMTKEELENCCFRVYYAGNKVSIEAFHALTDGYGAITTFTTLIAEYLQLQQGVVTPVCINRLNPADEPQPQEYTDSYPEMADGPAKHLPSRFSYLPPMPQEKDWQVRSNALTVDIPALLEAAHRYDVTLNTLLTAVLASSIMDMQVAQRGTKKLKPVRIMVPIDLRRMIGSRTLRNCSLYCLPTMEGHQHDLPMKELCRIFGDQLKQQLSKESLTAMVSYNVKTQSNPLFKAIPWKLKSAALRLGYRFFGESNSSLTLTNLGLVKLPEEIAPHVENFQCWLTPRVSSPYGCSVLSFNGKLTLTMSRFGEEDELSPIFFKKLKDIIAE